MCRKFKEWYLHFVICKIYPDAMRLLGNVPRNSKRTGSRLHSHESLLFAVKPRRSEPIYCRPQLSLFDTFSRRSSGSVCLLIRKWILKVRKHNAHSFWTSLLFCNILPLLSCTVLAANPHWCLAVPTAAHSRVSIRRMIMPCCAYSSTQYSLHTQDANALLCLQLHTVGSPYADDNAFLCLQLHTVGSPYADDNALLCLQLHPVGSRFFFRL